MKLQEESKNTAQRQDGLENAVEGIQLFLESLPTRNELSTHTKAMDETLAKIQEVSTGLTTHMETYKISESTSHRPTSVQARPSFTHPDRRSRIEDIEGSESYYTQDTREEAEERYGFLRGGNGHDDGDGSGDDDPNLPSGPSGPPPPGPPGPSPPGPPDPEPPGPRRRRRKPDIKPIMLKDPYPFEGKPGDDCETWWIIVKTFIQDQPEKFDQTGRTINWVSGLLKQYAAAWHVQWERQALAGKFPRSWTSYQNDISLRFEHKEARDEAFADLEKVSYEGDIRDMFMKIQMYNNKAQLTGAGLKKLIFDQLPVKILEQMHTVDLTGRTDREMIDTITKAGRTAEKWDEVKKNLRTQTPKTKEGGWEKSKDSFRVTKSSKDKGSFKKKFVNREEKCAVKIFATQMEGIPQEELTRRRNTKECMRCTWPTDRRGSHKTMDSYRPVKTDTGTVPFPKAKEYQTMKIGACDLEEYQQDLYTEGSDSEELRDSASEQSTESLDSESSSEMGDNWWESS